MFKIGFHNFASTYVKFLGLHVIHICLKTLCLSEFFARPSTETVRITVQSLSEVVWCRWRVCHSFFNCARTCHLYEWDVDNRWILLMPANSLTNSGLQEYSVKRLILCAFFFYVKEVTVQCNILLISFSDLYHWRSPYCTNLSHNVSCFV